MVFKYSCEILGLRQHIKDTTELNFTFNLSPPVIIHIGKQYSDGREPADPSSVVCVATTTFEIEDELCAADIRSAMSNPIHGHWANLAEIDKNRMPAALAAIDLLFKPLITLTDSTISILRWRFGLWEGPTDPFCNRRAYISRDGESWLEVHMGRSIQVLITLPPRQIEASPDLEQQVIRLVTTMREEPLGRQLFREAWNQRRSHPRSALVIGVAAAEVGLKKLIGALVPDAQWLVDEIQTPPIGKLLR